MRAKEHKASQESNYDIKHLITKIEQMSAKSAQLEHELVALQTKCSMLEAAGQQKYDGGITCILAVLDVAFQENLAQVSAYAGGTVADDKWEATSANLSLLQDKLEEHVSIVATECYRVLAA